MEKNSVWQLARTCTVAVNMIAMYFMQETSWCLCCSDVLVLHIITEPKPSAQCHTIWTYGFGWLSLLVKRCENHMAISLGCIQVIWATPAAWISVGPEVCGLHRNGHCWAARLCHLWVYNEVFLIMVCSFWIVWQCVCTDCVTTWFEVQEQEALDVLLVFSRWNHHLLWHL
jgi:hypothetical protein